MWYASRQGPAWSLPTARAGGWGQNGCDLARSGGRPPCATASAIRAARATYGSTWPSAGGCHGIYSAVTLPGRHEPWYLATSQPNAHQAVAWYRQRFWIEESFKDSKSRFHLKHVRIGSPERLTRLLLALTIALCWLALAALPESGALPFHWHSAVVAWGRASVLSLALALLDALQDLPLPWLATSQ
jgi:hypothetical protein